MIALSEILSGCCLDQRIAEGGYGVIFAARDLEDGSEVALKVVIPNLAVVWPTFEAATRAAAAVGHPGLVAVRRVAALDRLEATGAVVMERLRGTTIDRVHNPTAFLGPALDALAAAHRAGIVHGAVEPQHVFVTDDGRLKLLDFGSGAILPELWQLDERRSGSSFIGAIGYHSPERVRREPLGDRSDIYSLGCIFYEAFAGRPPFDGEFPGDIAVAHIQEAPAPRAPDLILRMLAKNPAARPSAAEALAEWRR